MIADGLQVRDKPMKQTGANSFASPLGRYEAHFESPTQGEMRMAFGHSFTTPQMYERFHPVKPTAKDLEDYAGDYVSDELQQPINSK